MITSTYGWRIIAGATVLTGLTVAACSSDSNDTAPAATPSVTVIGLDNDESELLTEMYAIALESSGYRVARRAPVADLAAGYTALNNGAADLFVSYTADLLDFLVEQEPEAAAATSTIEATTTTVAETTTTSATTTTAATDTTDGTTDGTAGDSSSTTAVESTTTTIPTAGQAESISINAQVGQIGEILPDTLQIGAASTAENKPVIVCNDAVSTTGTLTLLSDVARAADALRLAGTSDWTTGDPFGAMGFDDVYGATFSEFVEVAADKIGGAITPETPEVDPTSTTAADQSTTTAPPAVVTMADCGAFASSLDATIPDSAVVMGDDLGWIRTNGVVPLTTAAKYGLMSPVIDQVSQRLTTTDLRQALAAVSQGSAPNVVAEAFITHAGIGS